MTDLEFRRLYEVVDGEVEMAISCFYTDRALNQGALDDEATYSFLNRHAGFWNVHRYCLQSTFFITLGRLFDTSGDVRSLHTLLGAVIKHPELFSKDRLRARKIALVHGTPDWLEDRVNEAWEPSTTDLRLFKQAIKPWTAIFRELFAPIRHQVFGHSILTEQQLVQELFSKLQLAEIDLLLYVLRDVLSSLDDLFLNGNKPAMGTRSYGYRERINLEVQRLLDQFNRE
jgi:hypothetical protein